MAQNFLLPPYKCEAMLSFKKRVSKRWCMLVRNAAIWRHIDLGKFPTLDAIKRLISYGIIGEHSISISLAGANFRNIDSALILLHNVCINLQFLVISGGIFRSVQSLLHLPHNLRSLTLDAVSVKDVKSFKLKQPESFTNLEKLDVHGCSWISDEVFVNFFPHGVPTLQELNLSGCYRMARGPPLYLPFIQRINFLGEILSKVSPNLRLLRMPNVFTNMDTNPEDVLNILKSLLPNLHHVIL